MAQRVMARRPQKQTLAISLAAMASIKLRNLAKTPTAKESRSTSPSSAPQRAAVASTINFFRGSLMSARLPVGAKQLKLAAVEFIAR
jgi:hypothetical protein